MTNYRFDGSGWPRKQVSSARLNQKSGYSNAFNGYAKINKGNGEFRMRPTTK